MNSQEIKYTKSKGIAKNNSKLFGEKHWEQMTVCLIIDLPNIN